MPPAIRYGNGKPTVISWSQHAGNSRAGLEGDFAIVINERIFFYAAAQQAKKFLLHLDVYRAAENTLGYPYKLCRSHVVKNYFSSLVHRGSSLLRRGSAPSERRP